MPFDCVKPFFEQLSVSLRATVQQLIGREVQSTVELQKEPASHGTWVTAIWNSDPPCRLALGLDERTAKMLARAMISETVGEQTALTEEDWELLNEFWTQALGRASTDLKQLLGEHNFDSPGFQTPEWQPAVSAEVSLNAGETVFPFEVRLSLEAVRRLSSVAESPVSEATQKPLPATGNLDLLLDVPLAVNLRFGQRRMILREILQLASGSVIELDRQAKDEVDLLLDDRLIARGQVVVVDGCYGLRVTEVCR